MKLHISDLYNEDIEAEAKKSSIKIIYENFTQKTSSTVLHFPPFFTHTHPSTHTKKNIHTKPNTHTHIPRAD